MHRAVDPPTAGPGSLRVDVRSWGGKPVPASEPRQTRAIAAGSRRRARGSLWPASCSRPQVLRSHRWRPALPRSSASSHHRYQTYVRAHLGVNLLGQSVHPGPPNISTNGDTFEQFYRMTEQLGSSERRPVGAGCCGASCPVATSPRVTQRHLGARRAAGYRDACSGTGWSSADPVVNR